MTGPEHDKTVPWLIGVLILVLTVLGELSVQLYVPALPLVGAEMAVGASTVQSSLWLFLLAFGLGQLFFGPASDRLGRRPVLIFGLGLYVTATIGCLLAESAALFLVARVLQALGACAGFVMARAIIRDVFPLPRVPAVLATTTLAIALSVAVAPAIGGWVAAQWGWRSIFGLLATTGLMLVLAVQFGLPETRPQTSSGPVSGYLIRSYRQVSGNAVFLHHAMPLSLVYGAMMAYVVGAPFAVRQLLGVSTETMGLIFGAILSGFVVALVMSRFLVGRFGPARLLAVGLSLVTLFGLVTGLSALIWGLSIYSVVLPQILLTLGAGFVFPNAVAGAIGPFGARAGLAAALVGCLQMTIGALCGLVVSLSGTDSTMPMLAIQLIAVMMAVLAYRMISSPTAGLVEVTR